MRYFFIISIIVIHSIILSKYFTQCLRGQIIDLNSLLISSIEDSHHLLNVNSIFGPNDNSSVSSNMCSIESFSTRKYSEFTNSVWSYLDKAETVYDIFNFVEKVFYYSIFISLISMLGSCDSSISR